MATTISSIGKPGRVAWLVLWIGAAGSVGLTLYTGRHNHSILLMALFVIWVASPFIALMIANSMSGARAAVKRKTFYILILVLTTLSLIIYSGALTPQGTKPAFVFLVTPLLSWVTIAITMLPVSGAKK